MFMSVDIPSIKNMTYVLEVMYKLGVPPEKLEIVLNMMGQREDLTPRQVEDSLRMPLMYQLPVRPQNIWDRNRHLLRDTFPFADYTHSFCKFSTRLN